MFNSVISVVLCGSEGSVVTVCYLPKSPSTGQPMAEENREKTEKGRGKGLRGSYPYQEAGSPGSWSCHERRSPESRLQ